jgi:hypothetical protein
MIRSNLERIIDNRVKPSAVKALNLWNGGNLGLIGLSINHPNVKVEFINREKADEAWEVIRTADPSKKDKPKVSMPSMKGRISFEISLDDLIHFLPKQELVKAGIAVEKLKESLRRSNDETRLCDVLVGARASSPPELRKLFKQKFKQTYYPKTPPVQLFNEDFFQACLGGDLPELVSIKSIDKPTTYPTSEVSFTSKATLRAYVGQVALEFKSPEECERFSDRLHVIGKLRVIGKKSPTKWEEIELDRVGKVIVLDMHRLRDLYVLYPSFSTGLSSDSDYRSYLNGVIDRTKSKLSDKDRFLFELNNFLADAQFKYRILDVHFTAPRGGDPDELNLRCYFQEKEQAEAFLLDLYQDIDQNRIVEVPGEDWYRVDIPPTKIFGLVEDSKRKPRVSGLSRQTRKFIDQALNAVNPMQLFKTGLKKSKIEAEVEKAQPDFRKNPKKVGSYLKGAIGAVNVTGKENILRRFVRTITRKEYARLTLQKVTVDEKNGNIVFSLRAEEQSSLDKFKLICLLAGCAYGKTKKGYFQDEEFTLSRIDMERLIKYLEEHPGLIHKDQSLDFSTLQLGEAWAYSDTALRFQSDINEVKKNKDGSAADAHKKAQRLCEFLRDGFAHREHLCTRFNVYPEDYRFSYERFGTNDTDDTNAWQLQQVVPGDGDKQIKIVTVACATKPGIKLSDDVILHTLKQAIVAELFKSYLEGKRGLVDVKLDITDRLGENVSEEMLERIKNLARTKHFTRKELGITEEMVANNFPDGEEVSLYDLWLNGTCVNSYTEHPAREQGTDKQYASPEDWHSGSDITIGTAPGA